MVQERAGLITFQGGPLTLLGQELSVGDKAPDFKLSGNDLSPVTLKDFEGKILIVSSVPSLDTPVCDMETRKFNNAAAGLGKDIAILTVSMDLPFAQSRWCGAAGVKNLVTASDHKDASFGLGWGVLIKELRLLARAVFVVGKDGRMAYVQLVGEVTDEPDYDAALAAAAEAANK